MAYVGYESRAPARRTATRNPPRATLAWGRILMVAASLAVWAGVIATVRVLF